MVNNEELQLVFNQAFSRLKNYYDKMHRFGDDDEISPNERALRNAISNLPCAVRYIELKINPKKHKNIIDDSCYLIKYDFTKFKNNTIEFIGQFDVEDITSLVQAISEKFGLDKKDAERYILDLIKEFNVIGIPSDDFYIQFVPFDIVKRPDDFAKSLIQIFSIFQVDRLIQLFKKENEIDFKTLYKLKIDPILQFSEIVAADDFVANLGIHHLTLEDFQNDVADIQLIPTVPDNIKRVFKCAKDLYIFGYFKYCFFTVSEHYAYLALESAIKNKYNEWLGSKAVLTNKKGESVEMVFPTYRKIEEFCYMDRKKWSSHKIFVNSCRNYCFIDKKNWKRDKITVNEDKFPYDMNRLLNWLVGKKIINKWDKKLFNHAKNLRNSLSHLEFAPILYPSARTLEIVAQDINKLYHKQLKPSR